MMVTFRRKDVKDFIAGLEGALSSLEAMKLPEVSRWVGELKARNIPAALAAAKTDPEFAASVLQTRATTVLSKLAPLIRQQAALGLAFGDDAAVKRFNDLTEFGALDRLEMASDSDKLSIEVRNHVKTVERDMNLVPFYAQLKAQSPIQRYSLAGEYGGLTRKHSALVHELKESGDITLTASWGASEKIPSGNQPIFGTVFHGTERAAGIIAAAQFAGAATKAKGHQTSSAPVAVIRYEDGNTIAPAIG